ncbi:DUF4136 domain-containing protein [Teredinibacter haidensis]|mgnify:CR=1 FL=1|uniref:DUF4136 domain-containing protein n=1 Tax=Teredinibacter haidensis TaxID=2731755 RepID=UPI0009F98382|nr:DUF4136 domain-containing protein [Teredinibacter haidensis]
MSLLKKFSGLLSLIVLISGCANQPSSVDYREGYDFSNLRRYAMLDVDTSVYENPKVSELEIERVEQLMTAELAKRYTLAEKEQADFLVRFFLVVEERMKVDTFNATFGMFRGGYGYHYGLETPEVKNTYFQQGSIIVDILDAKTDDVIWRGSTEGKIRKNPTPEERKARVARLLKDLFARFPPQAVKG